jgi:hypothetical protein
MARAKTKVSLKNKIFIWGKSAGRCQYPSCKKVLWKDTSAKSEFNLAYIAHIVASSPSGPRGSEELSEKLADDLSNLMLLCDTHHRLIDREEIEGHSVERLQQMKKDHEQQVEYLTSLAEKPKTKIVIYSSNIGQHNSAVDIYSARDAVIPEDFPQPEHVEISLKNSSQEDDQSNFWQNEEANLKASYNRKIKPYLEDDDFSHLTFFGLAPIPLLIKAGALLSDISHVQVRQLMKEPRTWKWDTKANALGFDIYKPNQINQDRDIALIVSTSAKVDHERIVKVLPNSDIWEIQASEINKDNVRIDESLQNFRTAFRKILAEIKASYQGDRVIGIFPAVSVSIATEMGRVWNGKSDFPLQIYDSNNKTDGFNKALMIE